MDDSRGSLYGHRLALTGCIVGLVGIFWTPFGIPPLLDNSLAGSHLSFWLAAVICQIEFPLFMLLYGLQDRLARPGCEYGYRFLGPHRERAGGDIVLAIIGSLLGAGLVALVVARHFSDELGTGAVLGGVLLVLLSFGALLGRRGCRTLWGFVLLALILAAVLLQFKDV